DIDWKHYKVSSVAPVGVVTHVCSTKIPYKTVGKEYLADRPELERELKNGIRDALRQLKTYLSRKGSIAMVQRKINIYSKYFPLIAQFVTELADKKELPNYQNLLRKKVKVAEKEKKVEVIPSVVKKKEVSRVKKQTTLHDFS
ncbi:MAG: hypothetical protein ACE5KU_04060, partial [Nitrososphaerales archaeon]